jgi:squalene-associated FAD-dependent desaturase
VIRSIAVVGGGVAGIAAAVRLAEAGERVTLIETRKKLGGRATSFIDPRSGRTLDNCQHVLMGCCSNLIDLYQRLGVLDRIEWHTSTYWANPPHEPDVLKPDWLPAPAHFSRAFLRMRLFTFAEKRAIGRAVWALIRMGIKGRNEWRGRTFAEFLASTGQPESVVTKYWDAVVVSACNVPVTRCDASYAIKVFQEGFIGSAWAAAMGISKVPLIELYDAAERLIAERGGTLQLGTSAKAIAYDGTRATGVVTEAGFVQSAAVVSAVPADRLDKLVSDTARSADRRLKQLGMLRPSPILGVHLFFPSPVMTTPHLVLPGRGVQWLFDKGRDESGHHHVHAVISGAEAWMSLDEADIVRRAVEDVWWALPQARGLDPVEARSVKEKRATFAVEPGVDAFRPGTLPDARGGIPNLFLAGDWTDNGWPATMEGACRSGYAAAAAVTGTGGLVEDVPIGFLAGVLGLR